MLNTSETVNLPINYSSNGYVVTFSITGSGIDARPKSQSLTKSSWGIYAYSGGTNNYGVYWVTFGI